MESNQMHNSFRLGVASWYRVFYKIEQFNLGVSLSTREPPTASKHSPVSVTASSPSMRFISSWFQKQQNVSMKLFQKLKQSWHNLSNPTDFYGAIYTNLLFTRLIGLFPYKISSKAIQDISYPFAIVSFTIISTFIISSAYTLHADYSALLEPLVSNQFIAVIGQLVQRSFAMLLAIIVCYSELWCQHGFRRNMLTFSKRIKALNLSRVNLDLNRVYRNMFFLISAYAVLGILAPVFQVCVLIHFFQKLKGYSPPFTYCVIAIITNLYKHSCLSKCARNIALWKYMINLNNDLLLQYLPNEQQIFPLRM